jgi:hypothetical protein
VGSLEPTGDPAPGALAGAAAVGYTGDLPAGGAAPGPSGAIQSEIHGLVPGNAGSPLGVAAYPGLDESRNR